MERQEFLKEVRAEIEHIKKTATPAEINRLDFEYLDPNKRDSCIYGQMTGDCFNNRAHELGHKKYEQLPQEDIKFENLNQGDFREGSSGSRYNYSSLEIYIMLRYANSEGVIKYLKGETETLDL